MNNLKRKLGSATGNEISIRTIERCLKKYHYSLKRISVAIERRNCSNTLNVRERYATDFRALEETIPDDNLIFVDEVGFSVSSRTTRGRSLVGSRANIQVPVVRTRNISVFRAMSKYGMFSFTIFERPINGEDYKECLAELHQICVAKNLMSPVFIMDNARIHHYSGVKSMIDERNMRTLYLPPYSPFMNPIENCFSKWKNQVARGNAKNESELLALISDSFLCITASDCSGYY